MNELLQLTDRDCSARAIPPKQKFAFHFPKRELRQRGPEKEKAHSEKCTFRRSSVRETKQQSPETSSAVSRRQLWGDKDGKTAGEEPIVWNESIWVSFRGHNLSFFLAKRQMPGETSEKCETTRFSGWLPRPCRYEQATWGFGVETGCSLVIIAGTLWKALLCS